MTKISYFFPPRIDEIKPENNGTILSRETISFPCTVHTSCYAGFLFLHLFYGPDVFLNHLNLAYSEAM